jgi:hypothetical protein
VSVVLVVETRALPRGVRRDSRDKMWTIPSWRLRRHRNVRLVEYDAFLAARETDRRSPIADEGIIRPLDTTAEADGANPQKPSGLVYAAST